MKFTEAKLEQAIIELLGEQGYAHLNGGELQRSNTEVLIKDDLREFLAKRYAHADITSGEIESIIRKFEMLPASDLYDSNKTFCKWLSDGFLLKRESGAKAGSASQKDLYIQLFDFDNVEETVKQALLAKAPVTELTPVLKAELAKVAEQQANYSVNENDTNIYRIISVPFKR